MPFDNLGVLIQLPDSSFQMSCFEPFYMLCLFVQNLKKMYIHQPKKRGLINDHKLMAGFVVRFHKPPTGENRRPKVLGLELLNTRITPIHMFNLGCPPSQDASGKWRFRLGSRTKNVMSCNVILVVTVTGRGDNPMFNHFCETFLLRFHGFCGLFRFGGKINRFSATQGPWSKFCHAKSTTQPSTF